MTKWLNLFRWPNLVFIIATHLLFRYSFFSGFELKTYLSLFNFILLSLSIVLIGAAGNVINDIFDIKTDFVNKRKRPLSKGLIGVSKAFSIYLVLNLVAVTISLYLSYTLNQWSIISIEIAVIILLYCYSKYLKGIPFLGNVLVSFLVSFSFVFVLIFDLNLNDLLNQKAFYWILFYSTLAFWANLNREMIKDTIDIKGDYAQNMSTLPILIGKSRMHTLIFISTLLLILVLLFGVKVYLKANLFFSLYFIFGICMPLMFLMYKIWHNENNLNYQWLSQIYKVVMLVGIFSLILFSI